MLKDFFKRTQNIAIEPKKIFPRKKKIIHEINTEQKNKVPDGTWVKCDKCSKMLYKQDIDLNLLVCPECGKHYRMPAYGRIASVIDNASFVEYDKSMQSANPINFPEYEQKIKSLQKKTGLCEAVVTGKGKINGMETFICVMDSRFLMGSMGSVVGEKITRVIEKSIQSKLPIIIFTASGGARMQEGIISLMQMAKVSAALSRHNAAGLLSVIVLTDPTTGGVTASFAMLGDIILSEPEALIGFAGQRVIEQTIKQKLPDGFQSAEFLLEHGFIDKIVQRKDLKNTLSNILKLHMGA